MVCALSNAGINPRLMQDNLILPQIVAKQHPNGGLDLYQNARLLLVKLKMV
jgi:hypothetical protein